MARIDEALIIWDWAYPQAMCQPESEVADGRYGRTVELKNMTILLSNKETLLDIWVAGKVFSMDMLADGSRQLISYKGGEWTKAALSFYNPTRKHVRKGMLSPVEFERRHQT